MRKFVLSAVILSMSVCFPSAAQQADGQETVMKLTGCLDPEQLDPEEVDRLHEYIVRPLKINVSSEGELRSSGLFSDYQVASVIDYIGRHGSIMSFAELAMVDGFNQHQVMLLRPFISLSPDVVGASSPKDQVSNDLHVKGLVKSDDGLSSSYAAKYRMKYRDRLVVALSASRPTDVSSGLPEVVSGHIGWKCRKIPLALYLGDFNARFGQGLAFWTGMSLSGVSSVASLRRNASGLTGSWSYTGSSALTGMAAEVNTRKYRLSAFLSLPGLKNIGDFQTDPVVMPGASMSWYMKNTQLYLTYYLSMNGFAAGGLLIPDMKTSAGFSSCFSGVDVSSEISYDWVNAVAAVLLTTVLPVAGQSELAVNLRYYPSSYDASCSSAVRSGTRCSNECGLSICSQSSLNSHSLTVSCDLAYYPVPKADEQVSMQLKSLVNWDVAFNESLSVSARLSSRLRSWGLRSRTDFRVDLRWKPSVFCLSSRLNYICGRSHGFLAYLEGGVANTSLSAYLRAGIYDIRNWDDRIYVYERDTPGSFNVPFFYGRGIWLSLASSWKFAKWGKLHLRIEKRKPGKAELKFQSVFSF